MISGSQTNQGDVLPTVNTGGTGVKILWIKDLPQAKVPPEKEGLTAGINLVNVGYHDIDNGIIRLSGCNNVVTSENSETFSIAKKDLQNPNGGRKQLFEDFSTLEPDEKCYLRAKICYPYQTHLSQQVCLDPDAHTSEIGKPCKLISPIKPPAQGAPVQIDKIEYMIGAQSDTATEFIFNIFVNNGGKGKVYEDSAWANPCTPDSAIVGHLNVVKISARLGSVKLDCDPAQITIIKNEKKRIPFRCSANIPNERGTFQTLLTAEIYYGYTESSQIDLEITGKPKDPFKTDEKPVCASSNCFSRIWGVCSGTDSLGNTHMIYGKESTDQCTGINEGKVCCEFSKPICERDYTGYRCITGCTPDQDHEYMCPGNLGCCQVS